MTDADSDFDFGLYQPVTGAADQTLSRFEYHRFFDEWRATYGTEYADPSVPIPACDDEQIPQVIEDDISNSLARHDYGFSIGRAQGCCARYVLIWEDRREWTKSSAKRKGYKISNRKLSQRQMEDLQDMFGDSRKSRTKTPERGSERVRASAPVSGKDYRSSEPVRRDDGHRSHHSDREQRTEKDDKRHRLDPRDEPKYREESRDDRKYREESSRSSRRDRDDGSRREHGKDRREPRYGEDPRKTTSTSRSTHGGLLKN